MRACQSLSDVMGTLALPRGPGPLNSPKANTEQAPWKTAGFHCPTLDAMTFPKFSNQVRSKPIKLQVGGSSTLRGPLRSPHPTPVQAVPAFPTPSVTITSRSLSHSRARRESADPSSSSPQRRRLAVTQLASGHVGPRTQLSD